jgi:S-adenosylmethionine hydrolase
VIVLFTDFSYSGPYVGQIKAHLIDQAPSVPVVDLMHDAPAFNARASAYLLAAYLGPLPASAIVIAVVDPGVGGSRRAIAVQAGARWLIGPDNGLLAVHARRAEQARVYLLPVPDGAAASFHGRDVFAPAAARIAAGSLPVGDLIDQETLVGWDWPEQLAEVLYIDSYGNAVTGLSADTIGADTWLEVRGRRLPPHRTFGDAAAGASFWYRNSSGMVELAVNQDSVAEVLGLRVGDPVVVHGA